MIGGVIIVLVLGLFCIGAFLVAHGKRKERPRVPPVHRWPGI